MSLTSNKRGSEGVGYRECKIEREIEREGEREYTRRRQVREENRAC